MSRLDFYDDYIIENCYLGVFYIPLVWLCVFSVVESLDFDKTNCIQYNLSISLEETKCHRN
jgi:hypothetical protein